MCCVHCISCPFCVASRFIEDASFSIITLFPMEKCDEQMWIHTLDFAVGLSLGLDTLCSNLPLKLQWQPVAHVLTLSKRSCAIVKSLLAQNSVFSLLWLGWRTEKQIRKELNLAQMSSDPWTAQNPTCAVTTCMQRTGIWVPWCDPRRRRSSVEVGKEYQDPLAITSEPCFCSQGGRQGSVEEWMAEHGPCLVLCSVRCLAIARELQTRWPGAKQSWKFMRGVRALDSHEINSTIGTHTYHY
jgi:hypothetical protein